MTERIGSVRIAVIGAGSVGRAVVDLLARRVDVGRILVADADLGAAQQAAAPRPGTTTLTAVAVDATDRAAVHVLLRHVDLVVNATGPFFRFRQGLLAAAIEARTDYVDVGDDWRTTLAQLEMHHQAVAAGVTAVVGAGASPGTLNLLAVLAARQLDVVTDLVTAWPVDVPFGGDGPDERARRTPSATAVQWMDQLSGGIRVVEQGVPVDRRPLEPWRLDYPGAGSGVVYTVGDPAPVTLPRSVAVTGRCACAMVATAPMAAYLTTLRHEIDSRYLSLDEAANALGTPTALRVARAWLRGSRMPGPGRLPPFFALATGWRGGRHHRVGVRLLRSPQGISRAAAVPLALAAGQILDGTARTPGVLAPEAALDPRRFFGDLAAHCGPAAPPAEVLAFDHHDASAQVPAR